MPGTHIVCRLARLPREAGNVPDIVLELRFLHGSGGIRRGFLTRSRAKQLLELALAQLRPYPRLRASTFIHSFNNC